MSDFKKFIEGWKKNKFSPVYWFEGEEDYYIDELTRYAENEILSEEDAAFNLTVFYGRDAEWTSVINACRRYPMNAAKQVVILKEAQLMKELDKLEQYIAAPLKTTIFIVGYKGKLDKRLKINKALKENAVVANFPKLRDDKLPEWILTIVKEKGFTIRPKAVNMLAEQIGNDLNRLVNEVDKLAINLKGKTAIDEDDIEKYIGISKEYNSFELLGAVCKKDLAKAIKILNYFEANPKANPLQIVLPVFYAHFSKVYMVHTMIDQSDFALKPLFFYNPVTLQQVKDAVRNYDYAAVEKILLLLHHYNLKSVGINVSYSSTAALLKEMIVKIIML